MKKNEYEFPAYEAGVPCHTIGFHVGPHDEELASAAYLYMYGKNLHPGIRDVIDNENFIFVTAGSTTYRGKDWQQCHLEGIIFIGCMGSPYDEHFLPNEIRLKECSTTLVTRGLKIHQNTDVKPVLKELLQSDRQSEGGLLSFSSHLTRAYKFFGSDNPESMKKVATWGIEPFKWCIQHQNNMITATKQELAKCSHSEIISYMGKSIKVAYMTSDNDQIVALARTSAGIGAHIVICKNSKGQIVIIPSKFPFIDLSVVYTEIIKEELVWRGIAFNENDPRLESGQPFPEVPWHFQEEESLHRLFNGSFSAPDTEPTKIPLGRIVGIVTMTLKKMRWNEATVRQIA